MEVGTNINAAYAALVKERDELMERLNNLEKAIQAVAPLAGTGGQAPLFEERKPQGALLDALVKVISDGKTHSLKDLENRVLEQGFRFGSKSAGRAIHFRMVGLKNRGRAEQVNGGWRAPR